MRNCWLSDIHLNFLLAGQVQEFLLRVAATGADAVLVGGDIGEAHNVCEHLERMRAVIGKPIYFVLGNHDYYHGAIKEVRDEVTRFCAERVGLTYLTSEGVVSLTDGVALVGHDGWADGRAGDFARSLVGMMDYKLIADFVGHSKRSRWDVLMRLGDEAAAHIRQVLPRALEVAAEVILLAHVPPLREACWHEGRISDDEWSPHFTCVAMGQAILEIMADHPRQKLTVLCGHTHGAGQCHPLANVRVLTAGAEYGRPALQSVFQVGGSGPWSVVSGL
jgi:predicted MPP superfamily phosphohydrolase